jgi:hypothetical protein
LREDFAKFWCQVGPGQKWLHPVKFRVLPIQRLQFIQSVSGNIPHGGDAVFGKL